MALHLKLPPPGPKAARGHAVNLSCASPQRNFRFGRVRHPPQPPANSGRARAGTQPPQEVSDPTGSAHRSGCEQRGNDAHLRERNIRREHKIRSLDAAAPECGGDARQILAKWALHMIRNPQATFWREFGYDVKGEDRFGSRYPLDQLPVEMVGPGRKNNPDQIGIWRHGGFSPDGSDNRCCRHTSFAWIAKIVETGLTWGDNSPLRLPKKKPPSMRGSSLTA